MLSQFLHKARSFQITGGTFNQVQGDHYNNNNYKTTIVQVKDEEPSEFDEYSKVKLGGIFKLRDVGSYAYPRFLDDKDDEEKRIERWKDIYGLRADRTVYTARVLEQPGMVFTVLRYSGPDAWKAFLEDFRMFSNTFKSSISSLVLHNDLVPASQLALKGNTRELGQKYLSSVAVQLGCKHDKELWMDRGRGVFCRGPPGPAFGGYVVPWFGKTNLPLTADLLRSDVLLRFLASLKSEKVDRIVLDPCANDATRADVRVSQPTVISKSTNTPIATANNAWTSSSVDISDRKVLENGLTRFTLASPPRRGVYVFLGWNWWGIAAGDWLSQAWRIFHERGVTLGDDLSDYSLVCPYAWLETSGSLDDSEAQHERQSQQPIYLFVRSPPLDLGKKTMRARVRCKTSSLHYWSFDNDGRSPLSPDTCHGLGLPNELVYRDNSTRFSWDYEEYQRIHQYQLFRGFDPSTTDFARHLGYDSNIFQPANDSDRFEIHEEQPNSNPSFPLPDVAPPIVVEQRESSVEYENGSTGQRTEDVPWKPYSFRKVRLVSSDGVNAPAAVSVSVDECRRWTKSKARLKLLPTRRERNGDYGFVILGEPTRDFSEYFADRVCETSIAHRDEEASGSLLFFALSRMGTTAQVVTATNNLAESVVNDGS
ncbi:hypothetical protein PM082_007947 [Marasmius tenuissimus]|nr:hypothetical protein PM082_007947 [Marasmius tenuissimus]